MGQSVGHVPVCLDTAIAWLLFHQLMCQYYKMESMMVNPMVAYVQLKIIKNSFHFFISFYSLQIDLEISGIM